MEDAVLVISSDSSSCASFLTEQNVNIEVNGAVHLNSSQESLSNLFNDTRLENNGKRISQHSSTGHISNDMECVLDVISGHTSKISRNVHSLSESEDSDSDEKIRGQPTSWQSLYSDSTEDNILVTHNSRRSNTNKIQVEDEDGSRASQKNSSSSTVSPHQVPSDEGTPSQVKKRKKREKVPDEIKEQKKLEAQKRKEEKLRMKAIKSAAALENRSKRPGECLKYVTTVLEPSLLTAEYGGDFLQALNVCGVTYSIKPMEVPGTVCWTREVQEHKVKENLEVEKTVVYHDDHHVLLVMPCEKFVKLAYDRELCVHIQTAQCVLVDKKITLIVYGLGNYLRFQKVQKNREVCSQVLSDEVPLSHKPSSKGKAAYEALPKVSRVDIEMCLVELQLLANCASKLIDSAQELAEFVAHFTKAVAETSFKCEKQQHIFEWYAPGDSRNCVKVDKKGIGLQCLWQQQLKQFKNVGLETAQAITSMYGSPQSLIKAYDRTSSSQEAEKLLEIIPVRRGVGPLTTVRRVGPELSKKLFVLFSSHDGNVSLYRQ